MVTLDKNNKNSFKIMLKHLNVLYIEDEKNIRENIAKTLELLVNRVFSLEKVEDAVEILDKNRIDIIISDINLPKISGIDFIKKIREMDCYIPVILLTAYTEKNYLLEATKLKLVDYLIKPIDFNILNEALLKASQEIINNAKYIVDFEENISYNVMHKKLYTKNDNIEIDLTAKEIDLLEYFIQNNQRVISHEEIKTEVWHDNFEVTDSALKNVLNKLRKKVGKNTINNISGVGFRIQFT
ncbi:response regulator transcription factor [Arcobacter sp. LA11]|uniref:response regulator transcription factor n=1 Tax=Arcobacter sp. LA11 TaxID=1898176 RepID=UPI000932F4C0|nr:response regulator transcription factor [Arcobacter sp. LA11]